MGWPSLAAHRYRIRELALGLAETWKDHPKPAPVFMGWNPILHALLSGDAALVESVAPVTMRLLEMTVAIDDAYIQSSPVFTDLVGLACFAHAHGHDQTATFQRIAGMKAVQGKPYQALQGIIQEILDGPAATRRRAYKAGHSETESAWLKRIAEWPVDHVYTMALCPDHPLWKKTLRHFVLPLALLLTRQHPHLAFGQVLAQGAYPNRHQHVLYERTSAKPEWGTLPQVEDPATWLGFDAIEVDRGTLLIYHYLGFTWQAPLEYDPAHHLNAFASVGQRELGWRMVQETVGPERWGTIDRCRRELDHVHILVHDSAAARVIPAALVRAAQAYGVSLRAMDITERETARFGA